MLIGKNMRSYEDYHRGIETLKSIFKQNSYPQNFVNHFINKFLKKVFIRKDLNSMLPKKELTFVLPRLHLREIDSPYFKLKVIFRSKCM